MDVFELFALEYELRMAMFLSPRDYVLGRYSYPSNPHTKQLLRRSICG
jgi:hypothetical protein